jgi:hypothetical protein
MLTNFKEVPLKLSIRALLTFKVSRFIVLAFNVVIDAEDANKF